MQRGALLRSAVLDVARCGDVLGCSTAAPPHPSARTADVQPSVPTRVLWVDMQLANFSRVSLRVSFVFKFARVWKTQVHFVTTLVCKFAAVVGSSIAQSRISLPAVRQEPQARVRTSVTSTEPSHVSFRYTGIFCWTCFLHLGAGKCRTIVRCSLLGSRFDL